MPRPSDSPFPFVDPGPLVDRELSLILLRTYPHRIADEVIPGGYAFGMRDAHRPETPAGGVRLRVGAETENLRLYFGHVGYDVRPAHRGRHFAERSVRLLLPLARRHGVRDLWITCDPANAASRRTCERLGAELVGIVPVPPHFEMYARGEREKCRYRLTL